MTKYELFAKRGNGFTNDVLIYNTMPRKLRVQIRYIWRDALGLEIAQRDFNSEAANNFDYIEDYIYRELGIDNFDDQIDSDENLNSVEECLKYLMNGEDMDLLLSLIEFSIVSIDQLHRSLYMYQREEFGYSMSQPEAIKELNRRFRENGFGYEFSNGMLIRKDSEILHEEAVKPALYLLQENSFEGALNEFVKAYDHYRKSNHEEAIINAGKAFESTMRTIAIKEQWELRGNENASDLIKILVEKEVIPKYVQTALQGLGTVRNKVAHGQGEKTIPVQEYLVNYALHLCGTNIVMLIESYKTYKKKMGKIKKKVIVTGKVYLNGSQRGQDGFEFEVDLPYEDLSEDSMPIDAPDELIFNAINKKYKQNFFRNGHYINPLRVEKKEEIY